jgi:hypothetical protein
MRQTTFVGSFVVIACRLTLWSDAIRPPKGTDRTAAVSISSTRPKPNKCAIKGNTHGGTCPNERE